MWMMLRVFVGLLLIVFSLGLPFVDTSKKEYWIGGIFLAILAIIILVHVGANPS